MNEELKKQKNYWDKEVAAFDAIYSHDKGCLGNLADRLLRWDMYKRFEYTMANSEPIEGRTFLDVGCGTGRYSLEYARRKARLVVGLDISTEMVKTCSKRAEALGFADSARFIHGDPLGFEPETPFDVTIAIGLFDYIKDPLPVVRKMAAMTRDRVIISFPTIWTWKAAVRKIRLGMANCDVFFYTKGQVAHLMREAGFERFDIEKIGQLYCVTGYKTSSE
jgi:cyclopropane fatty-acyl-phospholipid synthase-like methyltransferase